MLETSGKEVKKLRIRPGWLLTGLLIFLLAVTRIAGDVYRYELRQENARLEQALSELEAELAEKRRETAPLPWELGPPAEGQTVILHLRGEK